MDLFVFLFWLAVFYWISKKVVEFIFPAWKNSDPSAKRKKNIRDE